MDGENRVDLKTEDSAFARNTGMKLKDLRVERGSCDACGSCWMIVRGVRTSAELSNRGSDLEFTSDTRVGLISILLIRRAVWSK